MENDYIKPLMLSDLIKQCQDILKEHGDIMVSVEIWRDEHGHNVYDWRPCKSIDVVKFKKHNGYYPLEVYPITLQIDCLY